MLKTIYLTIGSLLFTLVLLIIYSYKARVAKHSNKFFKLLLILLIGVLVTEALSVYTIVNHDRLMVLNEIICRIHSIFVLGWSISMARYLSSYMEYKTSKVIENKKLDYIYIALFGITTLISTFLDFEYQIVGNTGYLSGPCLTFMFIVGFAIVIIAALLVVLNRKDVLITQSFPIIVSIIETLILVPSSLLIPTVYIVTTSFAFKMYLIYFTLENPDLYLISELKKAEEKEINSNRAKTDFLSNMSHEIRTPMNAIIGVSESILTSSRIDVNEVKKDIEHIHSAGGNLLEIINNILDISKIESGEEILEEKEYSLANLVLELHSLIDARINKEKVKFISNIDETTPSKVYGDKTKVFQVLLNILSNATKYTDVGRIELNIKSTINKNKVLLNIRISDTGMGIKQEDYNKLFEKFSRLDGATQNEIEGTGLGLVITKKLVTFMGGKIWFESKYGAGTDFYVELEQTIIDPTPIGNIFEIKKDQDLSNNSKYFDCSNYKVLLVDDNNLNLKVAKKLLSPYKFEIITMTSGKECIDSIKLGDHYDMIFLDHMMPQMDGIEVLHIIKSLKGYNIPPIVALTANAITGMKEMYLNEGFDEYLSKPINVSELNKLLEKYFK